MNEQDDLELSIETTWIEQNGAGYDRVVVLNFFSKDCLSSNADDMMRTVGEPLRERVAAKLEKELGLKHETDYIFAIYDTPKMYDGKWISAPIPGDMRTIIRLRNEEHFTMFKLHYHGN